MRSFRDRGIEPTQHPARTVKENTGMGDVGIDAFLAKKPLQLAG
jgi:hypothetical protein